MKFLAKYMFCDAINTLIMNKLFVILRQLTNHLRFQVIKDGFIGFILGFYSVTLFHS